MPRFSTTDIAKILSVLYPKYNWEYEHPLREIFDGVESISHFSDRCFQLQLTRITKILEGEDSISDYLDHYSKMWAKRYFPEVR